MVALGTGHGVPRNLKTKPGGWTLQAAIPIAAAVAETLSKHDRPAG